MCKVDVKCIKLKWVRTLLRITCLADTKSYVVIICASACEKLTKSEIVSSWSWLILLKITSMVSRKSYLLIIYIMHMTTKHSITSIWPFEGHTRSKVMRSTEIPYMTYCMCFIYTLVITCTIQKIQPIKNSITLIWLLKVIQGQKSWSQLRDHIWLTISVSYKLWL